MSTLSVHSDDSRMSYAMEDYNGSQMEFSVSGSLDLDGSHGTNIGDTPGAPDTQDLHVEGNAQHDDANHEPSITDDGRSWIFVYKYGERYINEQGKERIRCKVRGCNKTYSSIKKTTTTFITHLSNAHGITESTGPHAQHKERGGPLDSFLTKRAKTFNQSEFHKQFIKFLVSSKLPFTTSENKDLQQLLEMAQMAPTISAIKLPGADTFTRKVC